MKPPLESFGLSLFLVFPDWKMAQAEKARQDAESRLGAKADDAVTICPGDVSCTYEKGRLVLIKRDGVIIVGIYFASLPPLGCGGTQDPDETRITVLEKEVEPQDILNICVVEIERTFIDLFEETVGAALILWSPLLERSSRSTCQATSLLTGKSGSKFKNLSLFLVKTPPGKDNSELLFQVCLLNVVTDMLTRLLSSVENYAREMADERNFLENETFEVFRGSKLEGTKRLSELEKKITGLSEKHIKLSLNSAMVQERLETINYRAANINNHRNRLEKFFDSNGAGEIGSLFCSLNEDAGAKIALLERGLRSLRVTLGNAQTAITSMRMEIELQRSAEAGRLQMEIKEAQHLSVKVQEDLKDMQGTTLELQKKGLLLQTAAGIIEFILILYYSLGAWHFINEEGFAEASPLFRFTFGILMALSLTGMGHFLTVSIRDKRLDRWLLPCLAVTIIMLLLAWL